LSYLGPIMCNVLPFLEGRGLQSKWGRSVDWWVKCWKPTGEDEIRPEILKALNSEVILWATRVG